MQGFAEDVLGSDSEVVSLFTNHPKLDDVTAFNQALCGLYAAGLGRGIAGTSIETPATASVSAVPAPAGTQKPSAGEKPATVPPVTITGASLGLPGTEHIFDDGNIERILRGDQFIRPIPGEFRQAMLDKRIRRLVKSEKGEPTFESITDVADVIKLAGRGGAFDLESEFGVPAEHLAALDRVTRLAIAAGIDAMRDAGIPLVMRYKTTTKGTQLPERWGLPDAMRDDTGVIFGSAFPGYDSYAEIMSGYFTDRARRDELAMLEKWSAQGGRTAIPLSARMWRAVSTSCAPPSRRTRMSSTGVSCSGSCRWDIRSSPNSSALAVPTRKSMPLVQPRRKASRWPKTGSAPDAAAA